MKLRLDLLPRERKSVARDIKVWIVAAIMLVSTFVWYIPVKSFYNIKYNKLVSENNTKKSKVAVENSKVENIKNVLNAPLKVNTDINYLITFLGEKSYSWYRFFDSIEDSCPEGLWISKIEKNSINDFYLNGEAEDNYRVSEFYHNMMKKSNFTSVYLLNSKQEYLDQYDITVFKFKLHVVLKEEIL